MSRIEKRDQEYYLLCGQRHEKNEGTKKKLCWRSTSQQRKQLEQEPMVGEEMATKQVVGPWERGVENRRARARSWITESFGGL